MVRFENLSKSFYIRGRRQQVIDNLTLTLPAGRSLALLGRNGAGKSTLLNIISGVLQPDTGRVTVDGMMSWPIGLGGSFNPDMTGAQNSRFVARIYGLDSDSLVTFVEDFAELGDHFHAPVRTYSSGMRARLGFGISMGIKFDIYLIDETTAVGDARFSKKSRSVFLERIKTASAIMVSHQMNTVRAFCDSGLVLHDGKIEFFDDLEAAIHRHTELNGAPD
jgi:capsular polysaccharide transport system ATP-binding protein